MTAHEDRPHRTDVQRTQNPAGRQTAQDAVGVVARMGSAAQGAARSDRVVAWIGWHLGELVGVGVPAVLAVTVHPVWTVAAGLVAAGWIANEIRVARSRGPRAARLDPEDAGQEPGTGEEGVRRGLA